jgi:hypothetical protein
VTPALAPVLPVAAVAVLVLFAAVEVLAPEPPELLSSLPQAATSAELNASVIASTRTRVMLLAKCMAPLSSSPEWTRRRPLQRLSV